MDFLLNIKVWWLKLLYKIFDSHSCASPLIIAPLRSLQDNEAIGSHLISRHMGKSLSEVQHRMAMDTSLLNVSSFWDEKVAKVSINYTISENLLQILGWLYTDPNDRREFQSNIPIRSFIGFRLDRVSRRAYGCRRVKVVLERITLTPQNPQNFYIITAYPI